MQHSKLLRLCGFVLLFSATSMSFAAEPLEFSGALPPMPITLMTDAPAQLLSYTIKSNIPNNGQYFTVYTINTDISVSAMNGAANSCSPQPLNNCLFQPNPPVVTNCFAVPPKGATCNVQATVTGLRANPNGSGAIIFDYNGRQTLNAAISYTTTTMPLGIKGWKKVGGNSPPSVLPVDILSSDSNNIYAAMTSQTLPQESLVYAFDGSHWTNIQFPVFDSLVTNIISDGSYVYVGTSTGSVYYWQATTGEWNDTGLNLGTLAAGSFAYDSHANLIYIGSVDGTIAYGNTNSWQTYSLGSSNSIIGLAYAAQSQQILVSVVDSKFFIGNTNAFSSINCSGACQTSSDYVTLAYNNTDNAVYMSEETTGAVIAWDITQAQWVDHGNPASVALTSLVSDGTTVYVATSNSNPGQVYKLSGTSTWTLQPALADTTEVSALVFKGSTLFAGTVGIIFPINFGGNVDYFDVASNTWKPAQAPTFGNNTGYLSFAMIDVGSDLYVGTTSYPANNTNIWVGNDLNNWNAIPSSPLTYDITSLAFDGTSNTLFAADITGGVYSFNNTNIPPWTPLNTPGGSGNVSVNGLAVLNSTLYAANGNTAYYLDSSNAWINIGIPDPSTPFPALIAFISALNGNLYVGTNANGYSTAGNVYNYDFQTSSWVAPASAPDMSSTQTSVNTITYNGSYLFCGTSGGSSNGANVYYLSNSNSWLAPNATGNPMGPSGTLASAANLNNGEVWVGTGNLIQSLSAIGGTWTPYTLDAAPVLEIVIIDNKVYALSVNGNVFEYVP